MSKAYKGQKGQDVGDEAVDASEEWGSEKDSLLEALVSQKSA